MIKKALCPAGLISLCMLVFTACDSFYSASWGTPRKYDWANIDLNAGNVDDWLDVAVGNPDLAKALIRKIESKVRDMDDDDPDKIKFQSAAVEFALEASGLGTGFAKNLDKVIKAIENEGGDQDLIDLINGLRNSGFDALVANDLAEIVRPRDGFAEGLPQFSAAYKDGERAPNVGTAAIIMVLATVGPFNDSEELKERIMDKVDEHDNGSFKEFTLKGDVEPEPKVLALVAYLNLIANEDKFENNPMTRIIRGIIDTLGD